MGLTNSCQLVRTRPTLGATSPRARASRRKLSSFRWPMRLDMPMARMAGAVPSTGTVPSWPHCRLSSCGRWLANSKGVRPRSRASARASISCASACRMSRRARSTGSWPGWCLSVSRSRLQTSMWSRMSSTPISMSASCWRRVVLGDSSKILRAACNWSASAACCCSSVPISGARLVFSASMAGVNCCAWERISLARANRVSASICTR